MLKIRSKSKQIKTFLMPIWKQIPSNSVCLKRREGIGFSLNGTLYIGFGTTPKDLTSNNFTDNDQSPDLWKSSDQGNTWQKIWPIHNPNYLGPDGRLGAVAFTFNNKAYIGTGEGEEFFNDLWEFDPTSGQIWTQLKSIPTIGRNYAFGLGINNYLIVGGGSTQDENTLSDVWQLQGPDFTSSNWKQCAPFPVEIQMPTSFVIGENTSDTFGFIGTGMKALGDNLLGYSSSFYVFIPPAINGEYPNGTWFKVPTDLPKILGYRSAGFGMSGKGYIIGNVNPASMICYEFDPTNTIQPFTTIALAVSPRYGAISFGGKDLNGNEFGFYGTGTGGPTGDDCTPDIWIYS
jgi:hypothetical protein